MTWHIEPDFATITRGDVRQLIEEWVIGRRESAYLVDFSEQVLSTLEETPEPEDEGYPLYVVLGQLDLIFDTPLFRSDGFALLRFLDRWDLARESAREELHAYLTGLDYERRAELLTGEDGSYAWEDLPEGIEVPRFDNYSR
jgi:hypothetical protein